MDREMTLRHLAAAKRHVALGERHLAEQRALIEELQRDGHDVSSAKSLLTTLEYSQRLHVEHRDRLERKLSDAARP